jgi:protein-tyrosine-phosphatase
MAEYLFNDYAKKLDLPFKSKSGGLLETGSLISVNSMRLLHERGINAQEHYSRKLNPEIMSESWLVLTMEEKQRDYIKQNFPDGAHKVFTLKEFVGLSGDIVDPYGLQIEYYREIFTQLDEIMPVLIDKLRPEKSIR